MNLSKAELWVLLDDRIGNRSQCLGVAEALSLPFHRKELRYGPWAKLPNFLIGRSLLGLTRSSRQDITAPWPDVLIAAGRRTVPVAREIKRRSGNKTKLVQIMWPGKTSVGDFDLICVPNHDDVPSRTNLFRMTGAPNSITPGQSSPLDFTKLPSPRVALLCGGTTKNRAFTDRMAADLGRSASKMVSAEGGSLLVTTSRRTGSAADTLIREISVASRIHRWDDDAENPYRDYLATADAIIVTGDSMSMCSEACSTGKPVYIFAPPELVTDKHNRLHQELYALGCARPLSDTFETWTYAPLNSARQIAEQIRRQFSVEVGT